MAEWLTPREAAAYLKIARSTLYRWCDEGRIPYYELETGRRRFKQADLDGLLTPARRRRPPDKPA